MQKQRKEIMSHSGHCFKPSEAENKRRSKEKKTCREAVHILNAQSPEK
jgi:hypothetical protein